MRALALTFLLAACWSAALPAQALDRPVARPPRGQSDAFETDMTDDQALRDGSPVGRPGAQATCPLAAVELSVPPWDGALARRWFGVALEHRLAVAAALRRDVNHFAQFPEARAFETAFGSDAGEARAVAVDLRRAASVREPGLMSLFALLFVGREQQSIAGAHGLAESDAKPPAYVVLSRDLSRRVFVGVTRFELERRLSAPDWLDDPNALFERRNELAPMVGRIGFAVEDRIRSDPQFLTCVAIVHPAGDVDYAELTSQVEVIGRNAAGLDAFLRFAGIDLDATLKAYARAQAGAAADVASLGGAAWHDRSNDVVYLEPHPTTVTIHLDPTSRDASADFAALISQWEHGELPDVTRAQMEALAQGARSALQPGPLAELLRAAILDLRTRYPVDDPASDWAHPRVGQWDRTIVGRSDYNTLYELQLDTRGRYAVPGNDVFATKRLDSPIGMLLAVSLQARNLPRRTLEAFARAAPTLHVALRPGPGLTFDVFEHPRSLTRQPGVPATVSWQPPADPPPAAGWEVEPFGPGSAQADDAVLIDVRTLASAAPGEPKSFGFHVCLLTPLDVHSEGRTIHFASPIWRTASDVPETARFVVYRRETRGNRAWVEVGGRALRLEPGTDYPTASVSPINVGNRAGFLELTIEDKEARVDRAYEYRVLHRCALQLHPDDAPVRAGMNAR